MKATAIAPANIAFIKYWGRKDKILRLPLNTSISMNLSGAYTTTTVEFYSELKADDIHLVDGQFSEGENKRINKHLDRIRDRAKMQLFANVVTQNSFPKGTGIASSASGFAALTVAGCVAAGLTLSEKELSILARIGSGSACRSIPNGFVEWTEGESHTTSYAYSLFPAGWWNLRDILLVVSDQEKKVSSSAGMEQVNTSPLLPQRLTLLPVRIERVNKAIQEKNFAVLGKIIEEDCLEMHQVMQTQKSPLNYLNKTTTGIMTAVRSWRRDGLEVYFTIDAGPNVHLICEGKNEQLVTHKVKQIPGVVQVIINKPSEGTHLVESHLF